MKYGSVCSGIEAATVAWDSLGWTPQWFSEIEPFPSAVLAHHYPSVPNFGDMTKFKEWKLDDSTAIDVLVGGTPCQSFSVAGLRKGLEDPRGNLMLTYLAIAARYQPRWLVWENVPGVLSSNGGKDFGTFLGALGEIGYGFAYRVLDAQYFGVAQRRRRVFVVGCLGDWRTAAAVLFERESLSGNPAPSRKKGQKVAATIAARFGISRNNHEECVVASGKPTIGTLMANAGTKLWLGNQEVLTGDYHILHAIGAFGKDVSDTVTSKFSKGAELLQQGAQNGGNCVLQPIALAENTIGRQPENGGNGDGFTVAGPMYTLNATGVHGVAQPIPFGVNEKPDVGHCLRSGASKAGKHESTTYIAQQMAVRRLTPIECERLQGFPDGYTNIPWRKKEESPDGPRYKALGNSMAVPVMQWIGKRIADAP